MCETLKRVPEWSVSVGGGGVGRCVCMCIVEPCQLPGLMVVKQMEPLGKTG